LKYSSIAWRFDGNFKRQPDEPPILLCGVDNGLARRSIDQVGFDLVVEAGLGRGYKNYRSMRLHTLPATRPASVIWNEADRAEELELRPGYQQLLAQGELDRCGVTLLAAKAVGARHQFGGGMGEVYRARDARLKRDVAIKILPDVFSRDADRLSRFQREAEVLASLNHPHIAAIHDLAEFGELRCLVLELVDGDTLADRIAREGLPATW